MYEPRIIEGGENIVDVAPDVIAAGNLVSSNIARNASRTALRYFNNVEKYSYVKEKIDYGKNSGIVTVGFWSPLEWNSKNTIVSNPAEVNRSRSFLTSVKTLCKFAGIDFDEIHRVKVMVMEDGDSIGFHADKYNGARSIMQLSGARDIKVVHPYSDLFAMTSLMLLPGDAYRMQFRDNENSIEHCVIYHGTDRGLPNVGIYLDE